MATCTVVWLDEIRFFLEDMSLTNYTNVMLGKRRRKLANFASVLPWLLSVSMAKERGLLGGFEEMTTGEEDIPPEIEAQIHENQTCDGSWSPEILGYLQPPVVVLVPFRPEVEELLTSLKFLRFHCGGRIYIFTAQAPRSSAEFRLDGSFGWSKSCKHVERCQCPRTPVSPYCAWGWHLWRGFQRELPDAWHLQTFDRWPAVPLSVTVVVFHFVKDRVKVLKFWRDATPGGHFNGWSVPGGSIATGKDRDPWDAAQREWDEEMLGHPWHVAVASVDGEVLEDEIEGCTVYRRGDCLLCVANLGEVFLAYDQWGDEVFSQGWSPRSNATLYAPAKASFYGAGAPLTLERPEHCVTPSTLQQFRRQIHTEGWPFMEHCGEAHWVDWDAEEAGAGIFPTTHSRDSVLPILRSVYGWA